MRVHRAGKWLKRLSRAIDRVAGGLAASGAALSDLLLLLAVLVGGYNVVARKLGAAMRWELASQGLLELQWYAFGAAAFLAGAWVLRRDAHVRVDVLAERFGRRWRRRLDRLGHLLMLLPFAAFVIAASWSRVADAWLRNEQGPHAGSLVRWPIKAVIPVAFALLAAQALSLLIRPRPRPARPGEPASPTDAR